MNFSQETECVNDDVYDVETFAKEASNFYKVSSALDGGWCLGRYVEGNPDSVYLCRREEKRIRIEQSLKECADDLDFQESSNLPAVDDDVAELRLSPSESDEVLRFEHHIFFSPGFQVPTVYFKISRRDGRGLSLEDVWRFLGKTHSHATTSEDKWKFVTQEEHPFLGTPFFHVHPCHARDAVNAVRFPRNKADNFRLKAESDGRVDAIDKDVVAQILSRKGEKLPYLITWMSLYGPVVGFDVSLSLLQAYCLS